MTATATQTVTHTTREAWLVAAVAALTPLFAEVGATVPAVRVSVGWPGGRGNKNNVIGQCWSTKAAADDVSQLFISPTLGDAVRILDVLAHELVHAVDDCTNGHKGPFAKIAKSIGLTGKMTATTAGDELRTRLVVMAEALGEYPHAVITPSLSGVAKQGTRMLKIECPEDGYIVRTTAKWLALGLPVCPCGAEMVSV